MSWSPHTLANSEYNRYYLVFRNLFVGMILDSYKYARYECTAKQPFIYRMVAAIVSVCTFLPCEDQAR